ncbi:MAG TPA: molybdate ABC transporter substrate-binding protein [Myxococcaceae bacterium]|nr:molybdate ABC transporter substrate-binding protein [Myxococcaceae bacterium]
MRTPVLLCALCFSASSYAEELLVFSAASTAEAVQECAVKFKAQSGIAVHFSFAGSNELARQIAAGAPADAFLSADQGQMDAVVKAGRVNAAEVVPLLSNRLVIVQSDREPVLERPEGLAALKTVALADPEAVPAGVYAKQWLEAHGLWDAVAPKVVPALDVRAALAAARARRAQAAIVYATDARVAKDVRVIALPPGPEKIVYPAAPVEGPRKASAKKWIAFLRGSEARGIFEKWGFIFLPGAP